MKRLISIIMVSGLIGGIGIVKCSIAQEEGQAPRQGPGDEGLVCPMGDESRESGADSEIAPLKRQKVREEIERLKELKKTDPERFQQVMQEKKAKLRKRLEHLKETDPEKYQQLVQKRRQMRCAYLNRLRKENPEKFRELVKKKMADVNQRLEELKKTDPEKYHAIIEKRHAQIKGRLENLKKNNPEKYEEFLKNHPRLKDRIEEAERGDSGAGIHDRARPGDQGVRDHGKGEGRGKGQGGKQRSPKARPQDDVNL